MKEAIEIGDLIAVRDDQEMLCGYGIVIEEVGIHFVRVHWFDEVMKHLNKERKLEHKVHLELAYEETD